MPQSRFLVASCLTFACGLLVACAASVPQVAAPAVANGQAPISERDIRSAYDRLAAQPQPTEYPKLRHILVDSQEKAQAALDRIHGGEPFGAVARDVSIDGGSMLQGGDLGWNLPFISPLNFRRRWSPLLRKACQ